GPREQLLVECDELLRTHGRLDWRRLCGRGRRRLVVIVVIAGLLDLVVRLLEALRDVTLDRLPILLRDDAFAHETLAPNLARRGVRFDRRVQRRLGERGLVTLVMSVTTIANEIDQEVLTELRAIRDAKSNRSNAGLDVVGVDVNDRNLEALCEIAR